MENPEMGKARCFHELAIGSCQLGPGHMVSFFLPSSEQENSCQVFALDPWFQNHPEPLHPLLRCWYSQNLHNLQAGLSAKCKHWALGFKKNEKRVPKPFRMMAAE